MGGLFFLAIPDKRFTFDIKRETTSLDHFFKDYIEGPEQSEQSHYIDFVKNTIHGEGKTDNEIIEVIKSLKERNFSIHYHVWDHQSMIDFFSMLIHKLNFPFYIEVAVAAQPLSNESIFVLRKKVR